MTDSNLADELANWVLRINKLCNEKDAEIERLKTDYEMLKGDYNSLLTDYELVRRRPV